MRKLTPWKVESLAQGPWSESGGAELEPRAHSLSHLSSPICPLLGTDIYHDHPGAIPATAPVDPPASTSVDPQSFTLLGQRLVLGPEQDLNICVLTD